MTAHGPPLSASRRSVLLLGLTAVAAALDALAFLNLGKVFGSFQSGNVLFAGLGVGSGNAALSLRAAIVLATFLLGTVAGMRLVRPGPARGEHVVLGVEAAVLLAFAVLWMATGSPLDHPVPRDILLAFAGTAMGLQVAFSMRLGVSYIFTVAITATVAFAAERLGGADENRDAASSPPTALVWSVIVIYGVVGLIVALLPRTSVLALAPVAILAVTYAADRRLATMPPPPAAAPAAA
jgi:uncharacterized membrane protein YoaK (UPF0700 family)